MTWAGRGWIVASYVGASLAWLGAAMLYVAVGQKVILLAGVVMWVSGAITAWRIPAQEVAVAAGTKARVLVYAGTLVAYRVTLGVLAGVRPEEWSAALGVTIPTPAVSTWTGWLPTAIVLVLVLVPAAHVHWLAQLWMAHRGQGRAHEEIARLQRRG